MTDPPVHPRYTVTPRPESDRWMTYVDVSFNFRGRVSTDNALAALDAMSIEREPGEWLVDRRYERDGVEGTYFAINHRGRKWLEERR